jgi:hypothetical protein
MFPSMSTIIVESGRTVLVVGRSAIDGGQVVFDGAGHSQYFRVMGGTLHISFVNLVSGSAPEPEGTCSVAAGFWECDGGSISVAEGGALVMRSCDIRGGGPDIKVARYGGGLYLGGEDTNADFYNVSITDMHASYANALWVMGTSRRRRRTSDTGEILWVSVP